jgi:hypothetical protein
MNSLLDIMGSTIVGGIVLMILFQVNAKISTTSADILLSTFTSINTVDAGAILERDISKLGYRISEDFITVAEEEKIEFWADLSDNGTPQKVLYTLGTVNEVTATTNPNDRPLFRKVSDDSPKLVSVVREFKITYLDMEGNDIAYSTLDNQENRNLIFGIRLYIKIESFDPSEEMYPYIELQRTIIPKNLGKKS